MAAKILGLVALVVVLFGALAVVRVRHDMANSLSRTLERTALATGVSCAARLERAVVTRDLVAVRSIVQRIHGSSADIRYIVVYDARHRAIAHTFQGLLPAALARPFPSPLPADGIVRALRSSGEIIFEAVVPILDGSAGMIRLGMSSKPIEHEIRDATRNHWTILGISLAVGLLLATILTFFITRPISALVAATTRIRTGDLAHRGGVHSADEIGALTAEFNLMADSLELQRSQLEEKEQARARLLDRIVSAQEQERQRIARDLHDELGQSLSVMYLSLQSHKDDCSHSQDAWTDLESQIDGMIDHVRRLAWQLRPAELDDFGLETVLTEHLAEVGKRTSVELDLCFVGQLANGERLPGSIELALYRVAQEAVTNIIRHADARKGSLVVMRQQDSVVLLVEDDGKGFVIDSQDRAGAHGHLGLLGMQERITALGGTLTIDSAPAEGTTVRAVVPVVGANTQDVEGE
ncbi:MAG: histidine kinase [bacterium]